MKFEKIQEKSSIALSRSSLPLLSYHHSLFHHNLLPILPPRQLQIVLTTLWRSQLAICLTRGRAIRMTFGGNVRATPNEQDNNNGNPKP